MGVDDDDTELGRNRQRDQLERIVASDEHDSAQQARRGVVRMGCSRGGALAFEGARNQLTPRQATAEELVDRHRTGDAAGCGAAESTRQRHLLVQPQANTHPSPWSLVLAAGRWPLILEAAEHVGRRDADHVPRRIRGQGVPRTGHRNDLHTGLVVQLGLHQVARLLEGQPEDVEPGSEIRDGGRREHAHTRGHRLRTC